MSLLNLDIINKIVAKQTNIDEKLVAQVNKYYWDQNTQHIRNHNLQPLNFTGIGYLRHSNFLLRQKILKIVERIRNLRKGKKYKPDGAKKLAIEQVYCSQLRQLWPLRNIKTPK